MIFPLSEAKPLPRKILPSVFTRTKASLKSRLSRVCSGAVSERCFSGWEGVWGPKMPQRQVTVLQLWVQTAFVSITPSPLSVYFMVTRIAQVWCWGHTAMS